MGFRVATTTTTTAIPASPASPATTATVATATSPLQERLCLPSLLRICQGVLAQVPALEPLQVGETRGACLVIHTEKYREIQRNVEKYREMFD